MRKLSAAASLRWSFLAFLALLPIDAARAQQPSAPAPRLSIEDVLRWRIASNPVVSPDARRVAYVVTENEFERSRVISHLWLVENETHQSRRLTQTDDGSADPRWSPDGHWLAFLSARGSGQDSGRASGEARTTSQVWLLPLDGGESFPLTRAPEGVLHYRWAPDGKSIFYVAPEPPPVASAGLREQHEKEKRDVRIVDSDKRRHELWRASVSTRQAERIFPGDLGLDSFEPSPDGKWIVFRSNVSGEPDHARQFDLWLLDLDAGSTRRLTQRDGEERSPVWSPDSARVAFLAPRVPGIRQSQQEVFWIPIPPASAEKLQEPQQITRNFSGEIEALHWPAKSDSLVFSAGVRTGSRVFILNPAEGLARAAGPEPVFLSSPDCAADLSVCAVIVESREALPDVAVLRPGTVSPDVPRLTELNPGLRNFALATQEVIRWKSKDGLEIEGVLVKPPDWQPAQKYQLLLEIHGGPHDRVANTLTRLAEAQVLAARGWLVLAPNFRGSSAYGHDFGMASRGDIGGKDMEDILSGVDYAVAQAGADPERLAVAGGSYGGYMTDLLIARTKRFKAAVSKYGIFNLITDYSNSDFPSWERDYLTKSYWEDFAAYLDRSAVKNVAQITTPVLILHGEEDNNTFISNSRELYRALKELGRTVKFVRFPREGHGFSEPQHRLEEFRLIAGWLDEHVPGTSAARARNMAEPVRIESWELQVAAVRTRESYAGVRAKGRWMEVVFVIRATAPVEGRYSVVLFDNAGGEVSLAVGDRLVYPEGLVVESLGQRLLVKSPSQVAAIVPDRDGHHGSLALAVAFDVPASAREFLLKVKDFPPVRIELSLESR